MSLIIEGSNTNNSAAGLIKDSSDQAFAADVIQASKQQPVLVDFWAPWCGPCKQLTPVLEKIVTEAKGKVKLVKVNIDENPSVAGQLRVQSIPAVFAFVDGRPVDAFMGALPESQLRQFIDRLSKMGNLAEQIAEALAAGRQVLEDGDHAAAIEVTDQVLTADPSNAEAFAIKALALLALGDTEAAAQALAQVPAAKAGDPAVVSAKAALDLALNPVDTSGVAKLEAALAANPADHAARVELAIILNGSGRREEATDQLILVIKKDRSWNDDGARKQLVQFFEAWGPKDPATLAGRRKLSSLLFA
jgi:putative thioredoxin